MLPDIKLSLRYLLITFLVVITGCSQEIENYTLDGDSVYVDDNNIYLKVTPHTITAPGWVETEFKSKVFSGEADILLGFENEKAKPKKLEFWNENRQEWVEWTPRTRETREHLGMTQWYYSNGRNIQAGKTYKVRFFLEINPLTEGKYVMAIKPHSETLRQAISNNHFFALDPWYNFNFARKIPIEINTTVDENNYVIFQNISYQTGMNNDFSDVRFTNEEEDTPLDYWIEYKVDNSFAYFWVEVDSIDTNNGTQAWMYYNSPTTTTSASNGTSTFLFFEDWEDFSLGRLEGQGSSSGVASNLTLSNLLYYSFDSDDRNSTNVYDLTGKNQTGNITGGNFVTGKINDAFQSINVANYTTTQPLLFNTTSSSFTLSLWYMKRNAPASTDYFGSNNPASNTTFLVFKQQADDFFAFQTGAQGEGGRNANSTFALDNFTFYHIVGRYNGSNREVALYINGTFQTRDILPVYGTSADYPFIIGSGIFSSGWNATYDEFSIWNRTLTDQEILDLYNSGTGIQYPYSGSSGSWNNVSTLSNNSLNVTNEGCYSGDRCITLNNEVGVIMGNSKVNLNLPRNSSLFWVLNNSGHTQSQGAEPGFYIYETIPSGIAGVNKNDVPYQRFFDSTGTSTTQSEFNGCTWNGAAVTCSISTSGITNSIAWRRAEMQSRGSSFFNKLDGSQSGATLVNGLTDNITNLTILKENNWTGILDTLAIRKFIYPEPSAALNISGIQGLPTFNQSETSFNNWHTVDIDIKYNCSDINGMPITYYLVNTTKDLSPALAINSTTGRIFYNPTYFDVGAYRYNVSCGNSLGNTTQNLNVTINQNVLFRQYVDYDPTGEGVFNTFHLDINVTDFSEQPTNVSFELSNTNYTSNLAFNDNGSVYSWNYTVPLTIPTGLGNTTGKLNFWNWTLAIEDALPTYQINASNLTIYSLNISECNVFNNTILEFNLYDEDNLTTSGISGIRIETGLLLTSQSDSSVYVNYSNVTLSNPQRICVPSNLLNFTSYYLDSTTKYSANDKAVEYYNIQRYNLSNTSVTQNISLYDLDSSRSTDFRVTFTGDDYLPVEDALIFLDRQYVSENLFRTVEVPKTDSNGQTILHLVRNDIVYNMRVMLNGTLLGTFNNLRAFCEDYTIGDCTINLNAKNTTTQIFDYDSEIGITFTTPSYDSTTNRVSFTFTSIDGSTKNVGMEVLVSDVFGNRTLCTNSVQSASGTLFCNIGTVDDASVGTYITVSGKPVAFSMTSLDPTSYGVGGYLIFFVMAIAFILMFTETKTGVLIGMGLSFVAAVSLRLVVGGVIGTGAAGVWLLIIIIVGIWRLNRGNIQ